MKKRSWKLTAQRGCFIQNDQGRGGVFAEELVFEGRPEGTGAWGGAGSVAHKRNSMGEDSEAGSQS